MLMIIALVLAAIPAVAVLYPFIMRGRGHDWLEDEGGPIAELERRWDVALAGLRTAELEFSIGNLDKEDYLWLRQQYMREAAMVMRGMELEEEQEDELLARVEQQIQEVRARFLGPDAPITATPYPGRSSEVLPNIRSAPTAKNKRLTSPGKDVSTPNTGRSPRARNRQNSLKHNRT